MEKKLRKFRPMKLPQAYVIIYQSKKARDIKNIKTHLLKSKYSIFLFMIAVLLCSSPNTYFVCKASETISISPYKDVYVMKYRVFNGKTQKRLWNATRNEWAEPYWHDA